MFKRLIETVTHQETDRKIKERDRIAMDALIKDQQNRVTWLEARSTAAKSREKRIEYGVKLREERRQLAQLRNPDEQQLFAALGMEL